MRKIALINQKGGVGKTTTAVNLGAALALEGKRVVLIDLDPQANLTLHLGLDRFDGEAPPSIYDVLVGGAAFAEALVPTGTPDLHAVRSDLDLSGAELELAQTFGRETLLADALRTWTGSAEETADYVLFDCPPSLGVLAINGLAAADGVFIPVQTEFFALQGMSKLVEVVELVRRRMHPELAIQGIVPCLYDSRLRLAREVLGEIRNYFPGLVFRQTIGSNVKLAEAPSFGQTIFEYAPESNGARDYRALAREMLARDEAPGSDVDPVAAPEGGDPGELQPEPRAEAPPAPAASHAPVAPSPALGPRSVAASSGEGKER